jgi:hypothetical protein
MVTKLDLSKFWVLEVILLEFLDLSLITTADFTPSKTTVVINDEELMIHQVFR